MGLEDAAMSLRAMRRSLERFDLAVGRCAVAVAGEEARAPACSAPGWASRGRSTRPAAAAAAALVAADVTTAVAEECRRCSAETGTDLRNIRGAGKSTVSQESLGRGERRLVPCRTALRRSAGAPCISPAIYQRDVNLRGGAK